MEDHPAAPARTQSRVLIESLPYLREYHHKIVVVKYGGHAMTDEKLKLAFALNIALLKLVGIHPVVVHGGGPQINTMLDRLAIKSEFRQGQRVTDDATMDVVEMVLAGSVNKDIVNQINRAGAMAVGLSGKDGMLLAARKLAVSVPRGELPPEIIDLGNVGEVTSVNIQLLHSLIRDEFVPVIAPVGMTPEGKTCNINADSVAGAVAGALKAKRLLLLTDVAGILTPEKKLLPAVSLAETEKLQIDGVISGGMIPKVNCSRNALRAGVERVTIVDGRVENCVLLELLTDQGIGTQILP
jgi:acetylglutamate kinase